MSRIYLTFFHALLMGLWLSASACAVDEFSDIKLIRQLPTRASEIASVFDQSRGNICEAIGEGEPVELTSFARTLTNRDRSQKSPTIPASRTGFMSIGLDLTKSNEASLPVLSRSSIVDYLDSNFLLLQVRTRRDLLDRKLYYHHRPIAVTAQYSGPKVTHAFQPLVFQTTKNIRSLGVFVDSDVDKPRKPEQLRTIVLIYRNEMVRPGSKTPDEQFEWVFVRGVPTDDGSLEPHVFVTEENRTKLVYLRRFELPSRVNQCDCIGTIAITEFDRSGLYPESYQTSSYRLKQKEQYSWSQLEDYCSQTFDGSVAFNLNQLLDALIQGKIRS